MSNPDLDNLILDHFRAYNIGPLAVDFDVELRGPFDDGEFQPARVIALEHLANPVNKNSEGITDPRSHQTWYRLETGPQFSEPPRAVSVCDQFGDHDLRLGDAELLLVPALKLEEGMDPGELDDLQLGHFKCYRITDASRGPLPAVTLTDQFLRVDTKRVVQPLFLGAPVAKSFRGNIEEPGLDGYLMIYEIEPLEVRRVRTALDQFGRRELRVVSTALLAVPAVLRVDESTAGG